VAVVVAAAEVVVIVASFDGCGIIAAVVAMVV